MSAASPAQTQVRRNASAASCRSPQPHPQARQAVRVPQTIDFFTPRGEEEIRVNVSDLPVVRSTLDVEGLKPSVLSRLFDLIAPLDQR